MSLLALFAENLCQRTKRKALAIVLRHTCKSTSISLDITARFEAHLANVGTPYIQFISLSLSSPFSQVRWVQQQHEKIRKKRDFQRVRFPGQTSNVRGDPLALLRSITSGSQVHYRSTDSHLTFHDPLFKEQWYLVSFFSTITTAIIDFIVCVVERGNEAIKERRPF
jgi:hypothetical protein